MGRDYRKLVLAIAVYSSASILAPMLAFGAIGFFADNHFGSSPKFLLISIGVAFVVSNFLLFRKRRLFSKKISLENNRKEDEKMTNK